MRRVCRRVGHSRLLSAFRQIQSVPVVTCAYRRPTAHQYSKHTIRARVTSPILVPPTTFACAGVLVEAGPLLIRLPYRGRLRLVWYRTDMVQRIAQACGFSNFRMKTSLSMKQRDNVHDYPERRTLAEPCHDGIARARRARPPRLAHHSRANHDAHVRQPVGARHLRSQRPTAGQIQRPQLNIELQKFRKRGIRARYSRPCTQAER